jgi:ribosomal protein L35
MAEPIAKSPKGLSTTLERAKKQVTMKTNKAFTKRLKITRNGEDYCAQAGQNHFNAKESRSPRWTAAARKLSTLPQRSRSAISALHLNHVINLYGTRKRRQNIK